MVRATTHSSVGLLVLRRWRDVGPPHQEGTREFVSRPRPRFLSMQLARAFARDAEGVADLRPGTRVPIAKTKDHFRPYGTRVPTWDEFALNLVDAGRDEARHDLRRQCRPTSSRLFIRHLWDPLRAP
jgi:hypothetical protein